MGESASITELTPFKVRFEDKRAIWEDAVRCLIPMFQDDGGVEYHGPHFDFPLRNVLPKPRQKPHPPLWTACSQLPTIAYAGERKGIGAARLPVRQRRDAAHAWVHAYYNAMTKRLAKLADYPVNPNIALVSMFMCAPTGRGGAPQGRRRHLLPVLPALLQQRRPFAPARPGAVNMWDEYNKWKAANAEQAERALSGGLIGSPETIRRKLRKFEASHIDQVILLNQAGRNTSPGHLRQPGTVRRGSDAGVPRQHPGPRGLEGGRAGRTNGAGGDRDRSVPGPVWGQGVDGLGGPAKARESALDGRSGALGYHKPPASAAPEKPRLRRRLLARACRRVRPRATRVGQ